MNVSYSLFLFVILCGFCNSVFAQGYGYPDEFPEILGFHQNERSCRYRRPQGFCRRRSECDRPSRHICRSGMDPIICCLDQHKPKTTTTKSTSKPYRPKEIDLTFPNCGFRIPKIQGSSRQSSTTRLANNRGGGLFSRRGKRSTSEKWSFPTREKRRITSYIYGGNTAALNTWPWMVAIFEETNSQTPKRFLCGASLISQRYVLTAAHCFDDERGKIDPTKFSVVVGSHTTKDGTEYPVKNILIHSDYKQPQYYNDISLLEIRNRIELSNKVYPVCLPSDGLSDKILTNNPDVTVTGWGKTSLGSGSSKDLQELTIPIVPLNECNAAYSKFLPRGITKLFICAGVKEGGKDSCKGDSGGPLVSQLRDNSYVQLGVVSFGYGCALAGYPGVYTRVSQYTQWLYDNTDLGKV